MTVPEAEMPKLPIAQYGFAQANAPDLQAYSAEQMHEYARRAVAQAIERAERIAMRDEKDHP